MNYLTFGLILLLLAGTVRLNAQDLSAHRWQDRLLLIIASDPAHPVYQKQLIELRSNEDGLADRKLVIYHILPETYQKGLMANSEWQASPELYRHYNQDNKEFKILLIGLDGGIKTVRTNLLTHENLFALIDAMPMRKAELDRRN